jgi:hypothetical protein
LWELWGAFALVQSHVWVVSSTLADAIGRRDCVNLISKIVDKFKQKTMEPLKYWSEKLEKSLPKSTFYENYSVRRKAIEMLKKIPGSEKNLMEYWSKTIKNYNLFGIEEVKEAIEELNIEDQESILIRFWVNVLSSNMRKRCPCESEVRRSIEELKKLPGSNEVLSRVFSQNFEPPYEINRDRSRLEQIVSEELRQLPGGIRVLEKYWSKQLRERGREGQVIEELKKLPGGDVEIFKYWSKNTSVTEAIIEYQKAANSETQYNMYLEILSAISFKDNVYEDFVVVELENYLKQNIKEFDYNKIMQVRNGFEAKLEELKNSIRFLNSRLDSLPELIIETETVVDDWGPDGWPNVWYEETSEIPNPEIKKTKAEIARKERFEERFKNLLSLIETRQMLKK